MPKLIFVSWSGDAGREIANALRTTILAESAFKPWISAGMEAGKRWFDEIEDAAKRADFAIGCMTPGASRRPWVNFEAGMLYGRLGKFAMLRFEEELDGPLERLQAIDGTDRDALRDLLVTLFDGDKELAALHINRVYDQWKKAVDHALAAHAHQHEIEAAGEGVRDAAQKLAVNDMLTKNECLEALVERSLTDFGSQLDKVTDTYGAPQMDYPYHLIYLQQELNARVKAIAILQQEEQFWRKSLGRQILETANKESQRVFVLRDPGQLEEHWDTITNHAKAYDVSVLFYDELRARFEDRYVRDFSIIDVNGSKVVANYETTSKVNRINYIARPKTVEDHEKQFDAIRERAIRLTDRGDLKLETVKAEVFASRILSTYVQKSVEMSVYVRPEDYDKHEEEHAYYPEMMQKMLDEFSAVYPDGNGSYRVLEFGAGTGIFTRRVARVPGVNEVVALEIDWACYLTLYYNVMEAQNVKAIPEDSRVFSPTGRFQAIFSSFADHHIKPQDKVKYLGNVREKLESGGVFIVGDEFLRKHDSSDKEETKKALHDYHNHIIEIARAKKQDVLVRLESAALKSGLDALDNLPNSGDYKLSCEDYEEYLKKGGFTFTKTRIGPADPELAERIGGVYVYVARLAQ